MYSQCDVSACQPCFRNTSKYIKSIYSLGCKLTTLRNDHPGHLKSAHSSSPNRDVLTNVRTYPANDTTYEQKVGDRVWRRRAVSYCSWSWLGESTGAANSENWSWLVFLLWSGRLRTLAPKSGRSWLVRMVFCRHAGRLDLSLLIGDRRSHAVASRKCAEVEIPRFGNRICL